MSSNEYIPRTVEEYAFDESLTGRHMVFLAGPRQVGKTVQQSLYKYYIVIFDV